ncbi:MAG: peptidylprolyl isomerase [candidate division Zixibacteria bacterium]
MKVRVQATSALGLLVLALLLYVLYDTLRDRTVEEKMAAIIHLEDRRANSDRLAGFLDEDSEAIRARAALAMGRIGDRACGPRLYTLLADSSIRVARQAAFALGISGQEQFADLLIEDAWDLPTPIAAEAITAAGRLGDSTMSGLAKGLVNYFTHPSPEVREATCYALFRANARTESQAILEQWRKEKDPAVRLAALYVLARLGSEVGRPAYIASLSTSDSYERSLALRGLASCDDDEARHYLAIKLNDGDQNVVAQAISSLAQTGGEKSWLALYQHLEKETDERLVVATLNALQRIDCSTKQTDLVYQILSRTPSFNIIAAAVVFIADTEGERAISVIDSVLDGQSDARIQAACATAYGLTKQEGVISRLGQLFVNEDPIVRRAAYEQLVKLDSTNIEYYIDRALNDDDFTVNSFGLSSVKDGKRRNYLPVMQTMISDPVETDVDVRRAVLETLAEFIDEDSGDDTAMMNILIAGLIDPEYIVRIDAAALYRDKLGINRDDRISPSRTRFSASEIEAALVKYRRNPSATIVTRHGEIEMELFFDVAPLTVMNFIRLAKSGFYEGLIFHRVIPNFVAQGGDPRGDGWGGPSYNIRCEYSDEAYVSGSVGIATSGKDTGGSQFFICHSPLTHLEGRYTLFGQVLEGMDAVNRIIVGDEIQTIIIGEDNL